MLVSPYQEGIIDPTIFVGNTVKRTWSLKLKIDKIEVFILRRSENNNNHDDEMATSSDKIIVYVKGELTIYRPFTCLYLLFSLFLCNPNR